MSFEPIKPIIQRKSKELAGRYIDCKMCSSPTALISLEDRRWKITCITCGYCGYLKEYQNKGDLSPQDTKMP